MYGSVMDADTYFGTVLQTEAWDNASSTDKGKALEMATRDIDALNYISDKLESDQVNEWPRKQIESEVVPTNIKYATYEQGKAYLEGKEQDAEYDATTIGTQSFGPVRTVNNSSPIHVRNGILSIVAWRFLKPYLRSSRHIELVRG